MRRTKDRQQVTRVAFATLAAVMLGLLAGCGAEGGDDALPPIIVGSAPDAHYLGALDALTNQATEELDARYERWAGDLELEQASAAILAYYDNAGMTACVAERGFTTEWERAIQPVTEPSVFEGRDELSPPTLKRTTLAQTNVQAEELMSQLSEMPPEPLDNAISECSFQLHRYGPELLEGHSEEDLKEVLMPTVRGDLAALWSNELDDVADRLGVGTRTVENCLEPRDLPEQFSNLGSTASMDDYDAVVETLIDEAPAVPLRGRNGTAAWRHVVMSERALELAAWECKKPFYADGVRLLNEAMDRFETRNADKIREAMAANQKIIDLATELGWSPEHPIGSLSR